MHLRLIYWLNDTLPFQINVQDKREKADKKFQDLHAQIVAKKPDKKPLPAKPASQKNKAQTNTKQVEAGFDKMQV